MSMLQILWAFAGQALLLGVLISVLFGRFLQTGRNRMIFVAALLVPALFVPVYGLSISQWLRSVLGDLSVFTWVVFTHILLQRLMGIHWLNVASRNKLLWCVLLLGVVLYPWALGVSPLDTYRSGYSPVLLVILFGLLSIAAWLYAERGLALVFLLPLIGFNLHLLESANLWDYLLDPVLVVYAAVQLLFRRELFQFNKMGALHEKSISVHR